MKKINLFLLLLLYTSFLFGKYTANWMGQTKMINSETIAIFKTQNFSYKLNGKGAFQSFDGKGKNYLPQNQSAPVLQILVSGDKYMPEAAKWNPSLNQLILSFPNKFNAVIKVVAKPTHITMELTEASPIDKIDAIIWGPYPTIIRQTIGELVGIVRNDKFAIGIQSLNAKTQGGDLCADSWEDHRFKAMDPAHDGLPTSGNAVDWFGTTAKVTPFGSILQMHCWDHERNQAIIPYIRKSPIASLCPKTAVPFPGESIIGSKIALFGCPVSQTLKILECIEIAEDLPHVIFKGVWAKRLKVTDRQYFCFQFAENTINDFIETAKKAGIQMLYHNSPWETWGHFPLKKGMFPNGIEGLKLCVDKAHQNNMLVGVHTLSGFITDDDLYVTSDDPRLAIADSSGTHIETTFGKKILFGNRELVTEILSNCANILNKTGLDKWEFDGLESNGALGLGGYGRDLMLDAWRNALSPEKRDAILLGSSAMDNYAWHHFYGGNWGEPWYDSFRKSHIDLRLSYIRFQARNYLPKMLGQFVINPKGEKTENIEWMMALSTGYDAGFSLTFDEGNSSYINGVSVSQSQWLHTPNIDNILQIIRTWREAQEANVFSSEVKTLLQNINSEFHLEVKSPGNWDLHQIKPVGPVIHLQSFGKEGPDNEQAISKSLK